jgi:hypothetical protein
MGGRDPGYSTATFADCVSGLVPWSACTKLSNKLDRGTLNTLHTGGLAAPEVGLESLLVNSG